MDILEKKKRNSGTSKEEFVEDIEVLFAELKNSYGGYDYFGETVFETAKQHILENIQGNYEFESMILFIVEEFRRFIYDGHFHVDGKTMVIPKAKDIKRYDYAVKCYEVEGITVIDIKKCWPDNEEERKQLETFAKSGERYRNEPYLIIDLRGNVGGSDRYIYEFLTGLNGEEPDPPIDLRQVNSNTFMRWLEREYPELDMKPGIVEYKTEGKLIEKEQKIYVLIDRYVASSGESAVSALKTMSGTVLLGENTWGCCFCGNCIDIYLPNSGICVHYGTGRVLYAGGVNIDENGGFAPDISGEFEVSDIIKMIKNI